MTGVKILVVDDEVLIAEYLKDVLNSLGFWNVNLAHSKQQALLEIEVYKPDMVLLDIHMDYELEGIVIAQKVAEMYRIPFIYITAHSDKEIIHKALETKPFGYITKPIKKMDVYAAITIALKHIEGQEENMLVFKDGYATIKLPADEILYAKSEGNYIDIVTANKKYTLRNSLEWFTEQLPEQQFVRVHRSYVANIKKITKRTSGYMHINDHIIPVSRNKQIGLTKF